MNKATSKSLNKRCIVVLSLVLFFQLFLGGFGPVSAQDGAQAANIQTIVMEVVNEPGSPVEITGARTELGFDAFGLPVFGKTYIDYKNGSDKAINAVKFRVRYLDKAGTSRGTFQANDEAFVPQGASASGKFAHYKLRPNIHQAKIRVLAVKFSDGATWESVRMKEIQKAQQEGREAEADDEATDKPQSPTVPTISQPDNSSVVEPAVATPTQPAAPPMAPVVETPTQPVQAPAEPKSQLEPSNSAAPAEEVPLSATPQSLKPTNGGDPFSSQ